MKKGIEETKYVIGMDIGGTYIRVGCVSMDREVRFFTRIKIADVINPNQAITSLINFLEDYIHTHIKFENVLGIGIGFPSVVSKDKQMIYSAPNLKYLSNINIVKPLEGYFNKPVYIERDVNYLLQYEISKRKISEEQIVLGFYIGTGFGNAIYLNKQFLEGKNGAAGELGHIPILNNEEICQCGNIGCIETLASGKQLVAIHKRHFSDIEFNDIFTTYSDEKVIDQFIKALAVPIATEINIFDPHLVLIGGGVVSMNNFPITRLEEYIYSYCRKPYPAKGLNIEYVEDTVTAGVQGAAESVYHKLINKEMFNV